MQMMRSIHGLAAVSAAFVILASCSTTHGGASAAARPAPMRPPAPEQPSVQAFSQSPFQSVELPPSRIHGHEKAVDALGRPQQTTVENQPDQYDPTVANSLITLRYSWGELVYLHAGGTGLENLILVSIHGNQLPLRYGLRFGVTTRERVLRLFGAPEQAAEQSLSYPVQYTQEMTNSTTFFFEGGVLTRMDISSLMMD